MKILICNLQVLQNLHQYFTQQCSYHVNCGFVALNSAKSRTFSVMSPKNTGDCPLTQHDKMLSCPCIVSSYKCKLNKWLAVQNLRIAFRMGLQKTLCHNLRKSVMTERFLKPNAKTAFIEAVGNTRLLSLDVIEFTWFINRKVNSSDGRIIRASASGAVNSGSIPSLVKSMTLKLEFAA